MSKNKHHRNNSYNNMNRQNTTEVIETQDTELENDDEILTDEIVDDDVEDSDVEMIAETEAVENTETIAEPEIETDVDTVVSNTTKTAGYQVGTNFTTADGNYDDFNQACKVANDQTKAIGEIHHVYDLTGKVVFSAKKKLILLSYKNKKRGVRNADWYT